MNLSILNFEFINFESQVLLALVIWLNENVEFHSTFSRHAKAQVHLALVIWLNENVEFHFFGRNEALTVTNERTFLPSC